MGALTETEIFDCMATNLRLAIGHARDLATSPRKGPSYIALRQELKLVEGCCRQASAWREDTRWLDVGLMMEEAHKRAGGWLRGLKVKDEATGRTVTIPIAPGHKHPLFTKLADNLEGLLKVINDLKNKPTGRVGMILPPVQPAPMRTQGRQIGWIPNRSPGGLIIPDGVKVA